MTRGTQRIGGTALLAMACCALGACAVLQPNRNADDHLRQRADRTIDYVADERGNRIPDFSHAGYMGGGVRIPDLLVEEKVEPGKGDDGKRIQQAIDRVSRLPLSRDGFRGAVLLKAGRYQIERSISISASGVVLRGEGQGERGTTIIATGRKKRTLIEVAGKGKPAEITASRAKIIDDYVPVGALNFTIDDARDFRVGDRIMVHRPSTAEWISDIGMDRIGSRPDGQPVKQWKPGSRDLHFDRTITAIKGDRISVDAPICNALERRYGASSICRYEFDGRISQVGVENLRGVSEYEHPTDEDHAWVFIRIDKAENAWIRDVTAEHFGRGLSQVGRHGRAITIQDCKCLDAISLIEGNRRYSFGVTGQLVLVQRCEAREGRHDFVLNGGQVAGPNVFLDCSAENAHADTGPHAWWCVGSLLDNVRVRGDQINLKNVGSVGFGFGWTGANSVLWNCIADDITCENPPTARNWAIGCRADEQRGDGNWASFDRPVKPRSLYLAQLEERLGKQAVQNIARSKASRR